MTHSTTVASKAEAFVASLRSEQVTDEVLPVLEIAESSDAVDLGTLNLGAFGIVEMILKRPDLLDRVIRDPRLQAMLLPRFLAISLTAFIFFGVAMSLVLTCSHAWPELTAIPDRLRGDSGQLVTFRAAPDLLSRWLDGSALRLTAAYAFGLIAATGVCLPSLYFYGLLAGVRMNLLDVAIQAMKSKATSAIALIGILPIYAAVGMGIVIFDAPEPIRNGAYWLGLILPFLAGLWGTSALYRSFAKLCDTLPPNRRHARVCFLRRLTLSWAACYTAVSPVMIFTLWEHFAR